MKFRVPYTGTRSINVCSMENDSRRACIANFWVKRKILSLGQAQISVAGDNKV